MAKVNALIYGFAVGEMTRAGMARIDQSRVKLSAEIQENLFPYTIGKGMFRPGGDFKCNTASNALTRLLPFIKSVSEKAVLHLSDAKLRVMVSDALVTRVAVTSSITNGDFSSSGSWTSTLAGGGTSSFAAGRLTLKSPNRGGSVTVAQLVTTSSANIEHALRIVVERGPVTFRCGSTSGGDEYIAETSLDVGTHSLAFTPTGSYYVQFFTKSDIEIRVTSIAVEAAGILEFVAPWAAAELREIRIDQSIDIVYLAHNNWQQRKIERRGDTSWSLVNYRVDDGPFLTSPTSDAILTPSVLSGNGTLSADRNFFESGHVGALFQLTHSGQSVLNTLAAANTFTDPISITRDAAYGDGISGTWVGTLTFQVSYEGADKGFYDTSAISSNTSGTTNGTTTTTVWFRLGFKAGAYTSGAAVISLFAGSGGDFGIARVVAYNSPTSVDIEVLRPFKQITGTSTWLEGSWSDVNGWPSAVSFFDGRLWWAREDRFWGSESDDYTAFNLETVGDAGSIQRAVATGGSVNNVNWMLALQRLLFGTDGSESSARASSFDQPLTPTSTTVKDASTQGVALVSPAKIDGHGVFIQRSGRQVYEIGYALEKQDFGSACLTRFNDEIGIPGLVEIAVQRQPQSYIWFVREDGQCPILLYDPDEKESAWVRFIAAPSLAGAAVVESVCILPEDEQDAVYLAVKRTINGSVVRFVEKMRKHSEATGGNVKGVADATVLNAQADAGIYTAGPTSSVVAAHLAGETGLVGWGTLVSSGVSGPITGLSADGSGNITLPASYTSVFVGLKYDWRYRSAKLAYAAQGGTALLQRKKVGPVGLLAADMMYGAIQFGPDFTTMDPLPLVKDGSSVDQTAVFPAWDEPSFPFPGGWDTDSRLCMKGSAPYPITLLGIVTGVETHETV